MSWAYFSELKPKIQARRFDDGRGNRFYYFKHEGETKVAAGITTVFGAVSVERESINQWKESNNNWKELLDKSAAYGTLEHAVFADIMMGSKVDEEKIKQMSELIASIGGSPNTPKKDVLSFLKWMEDVQLKPLVIEGVLVWIDHLGNALAMTIDLLAEVTIQSTSKVDVEDGVLKQGKNKGQVKYRKETVTKEEKKVICVDFKSNFFEKERKSYYETHKMQLMGAARAVYQNFNIKIDEMYNWSPSAWRSEPSYTFYKWDIKDEDIELWNTYWKLAVLKGINKPKGSIFTTTFKHSSDYNNLPYIDFVNKLIS